MDFTILANFMNSDIYSWVVLPILIFLIRICDVSLGTIRVIFISRGMKLIAPILGFFEVSIWLLAMRQLITNLSNPIYFLAYALGFTMGTYVGMYIENKLSIGTVIIRIITRNKPYRLIRALRKAKYRVTVSDAKGAKGHVKIIFTVTRRQKIKDVVKIIKTLNPNAFYSIEDIRYAHDKKIGSNNRKRNFSKFFGLYRR